jgi:hypothetical protein
MNDARGDTAMRGIPQLPSEYGGAGMRSTNLRIAGEIAEQSRAEEVAQEHVETRKRNDEKKGSGLWS